jgi:hypothetical protein
MFRTHFIQKITLFLGILIFPGISLYAATITYTPPPLVSLTGSNGSVLFDVADDIFDAGTTVGRPVFDTSSRRFDGAFYLSGAGWVNFSETGYQVELDCGGQSLSNLSTPCSLSGMAYSEMIEDINFSPTRAKYIPSLGVLSGTISSLMGEYSLSGIALPLFPSRLVEGEEIRANHEKTLELSGSELHSGTGGWDILVSAMGISSISYTLHAPADFSHATDTYRIEVIDPDGGVTLIDGFVVHPGKPRLSLHPATPLTLRQGFCTGNPTS